MSLFLSKRNATQYALKGMREMFNNQDNSSRLVNATSDCVTKTTSLISPALRSRAER